MSAAAKSTVSLPSPSPPAPSPPLPPSPFSRVGALALDWEFSDRPEPLAPGAIDLWAVELSDLGVDSAAPTSAQFNLLAATELARAGRIKNPSQRAMVLGGRAGMRLLLSAYTGLACAELRFGAGERGKPKLLNQLPAGELCFNYSLSGGQALYAFAWNRQLGVDLEVWPRARRRGLNAAALARRKLSAAERQAWRAMPPEQKDAAMLACWTRKEAYGKALGVGIRYALNRSAVCVDLARPVWQCDVRGLFPGTVPATAARVLRGAQLAPPFAGIAALVYDGAAVGELRGWRWRGRANSLA